MSVYYGTPGDLASLPLPPAAVNIASSTNATPIVVTTAAAHGLQTGQAVIINGHAGNTAANGIWIALVTGASTFALKTFAGGNSVGSGSGTASGTSQSLGMPGLTLPEDGVNAIDAACWNVPVEGLADMVAWLTYRTLANLQILKGGTLTLKNGSDGVVELGATVTCNGLINVVTDGILDATLQVDDGTAQFLNGTKFYNWGKESYPDPQRLTNADHTISANDGQIVILATPTSQRIITVEQATDPPVEGQYIEFWMSVPGTVGNYYEIKREGSGNFIVQLTGTIAGNQEPCMCRIHVEAGVWRLTGGVAIAPGSDA